MGRLFLVQLLFVLLYLLVPAALQENKPHIIIILADDMGWNDVSFHGSNQIPTPNIDAIAYNGVILNHHYVQALCTPSRAALMTGKYPFHISMQHDVIFPSEPRGLPLQEKLLSQYLKNLGYSTNLVGKWHLGYYKQEYTPLSRGFDTHFGYWNGLQDYYSHYTLEPKTQFYGIDMRRNMSVAWDTVGKYSTNLFTEEAVRLINAHDANEPMFLYLSQIAPHSGNTNNLLQAPPEEIQKFSYIKDLNRRTYAAMVSILDEGVGQVVEALKNRNMLNNSIIIFMSDNGAPTNGLLSNHGSNYPFPGIKDTPFEGAVRGAAAIWSPLIKRRGRVSNRLMHIADWLPTLLSAAGARKEDIDEDVDGLDMWPTIVSDEASPRKDVPINIDDSWTFSNFNRYTAIRNHKYKYMYGFTTASTGWVGHSGRSSLETRPSYPPETVLNSAAGVAIASVTVSDDVALTSQKIRKLRKEAKVRCNITKEEQKPCDLKLSEPCLFDLERDPCEMMNIYENNSTVAAELQEALLRYRKTVKRANNVLLLDPLAYPGFWNNTWVCWWDHLWNARASEYTDKTATDVYPHTYIVFCVFAFLTVALFFLYKLYRRKKPRSFAQSRSQSDGADNRNDVRRENESILTGAFGVNSVETIEEFSKPFKY